jgi:hypothetical protein
VAVSAAAAAAVAVVEAVVAAFDTTAGFAPAAEDALVSDVVVGVSVKSRSRRLIEACMAGGRRIGPHDVSSGSRELVEMSCTSMSMYTYVHCRDVSVCLEASALSVKWVGAR